MRIPLVCGSSSPLDNILLQVYHKNVPMIIQSLGSNDYLSLIYSPNSTLHHISPPWIVVYADHTRVDGWQRISSQKTKEGGSKMRLSETTKWGYRFPHTSYWGLDVTERVAERGTKTKPAEGDIHPNEGKQNKSDQCWRKMQELKMKTDGVPR